MRERRKQRVSASGLAVLLALSLTGCAGQQAQEGAGRDGSQQSMERQEGVNAADGAGVDVSSLDLEFSKRDLDGSYDAASATRILLDDAGVQIEGEGATAEGSVVTLSAAGTYVVSGSLSNGSITVAAGDEDKLQVVLSGTTVHNETGPALYVDNADKVFVTLAEGTENTLADGAQYALEGDDDNRDATLFSRDDLTINGSGSLSVVGSYKHAVCSNDDLVIAGGSLSVTSVQDGLRGKDCVKIADGCITVNAGDDAFHSDAFFYAKGGTINVESCVEGYEGEQVIIDGGQHTIVASDDALNAALADSDETDAGSGTVEGVSADEAVNGTLPELAVESETPQRPDGRLGEGGAQEGQAPDRGQRPDGEADSGQMPGHGQLPDGAQFPEGDSQLQAPTGNEEALADKGVFGGGQMAQSSSSCLIQINGGTLELTAGNDGIDSNGNVEFNGGTVLVSGPDAGMDGSLDYDLTATVTGGVLLMVGSVGSTQGLADSPQAVTCGSVGGKQGQEVSLVDASGNMVIAFQAGTDFSQVLASSPQISSGQTLTILVGGQPTELTAGEGLDMVQNGGLGRGMKGGGMKGTAAV